MNDTKIRQYSREALASELAFRRDRRLRVFSWCSTVLVSAIAGSAALTQEEHPIILPHKLIISVTIVVLASFTLIWINHHRKIESRVKQKICEIEDKLHMTTIDIKSAAARYQLKAIILLAILALLAVWSSKNCDWNPIIKQLCSRL